MQVISATVDLEDVRAARTGKSRGAQAVYGNDQIRGGRGFERVRTDFELGEPEEYASAGTIGKTAGAFINALANSAGTSGKVASQQEDVWEGSIAKPIEVFYHTPAQEIA